MKRKKGYHNLENEGYHNHGGGDFGFGLNSTSTIEYLWNALKVKIEKTYRIIPSKNFVSYLREAEWKYLNNDKSYEGKIKEFFSCFKYFNDVKDVNLEKNESLRDEELNAESSSDEN